MNLKIKWQRLVVEGETCERCGTTEKKVEEAFTKLKEALKPLEIKVKLDKEELSEQEFKEKPKNSNRIFIDGKPLEKWLDAEVGESECCDICGDEECRTVIVDGEEYENVPSELIIEAGLKAASEELNSGCCSSESSGGCCCGC